MTKKNMARVMLLAASAAFLLQYMAVGSAAQTRQSDEQIIRISASTFEFTPAEITVRRGIPVTLELISRDHRHGFNLPQFHLRADMNADAVKRLRFVPDKTGAFTFFCDVFCGDGHEEMSGTLNVIEP